jgi:hypothetical protein
MNPNLGQMLWDIMHNLNYTESGDMSNGKRYAASIRKIDSVIYEDVLTYISESDFVYLLDTAIELYKIAEAHGWNLDLHMDNFMMRGNTPVIIDPWVIPRKL